MMGSVSIFHHKYLRTAVLEALFASPALRDTDRYAQMSGMQRIMIGRINRNWLVVADDGHLFGAWSDQLRKACQEALNGIVEI
jgi:hypothetical protein